MSIICGMAGVGGIGYYHVSDTYMALFSSFIACGVWEAVYILDGLLQNRSEIRPDTLTPEIIARLSPYKTDHINRIGHDELRFDRVPPPITEELRLSPAPAKVETLC